MPAGLAEQEQVAWKIQARSAMYREAVGVGRSSAKQGGYGKVPAATHDGYMTKVGGFRKNWKKRWFRLVAEDGELSYFEDARYFEGSYQDHRDYLRYRTGTINIWQATGIRRSAAPSANDFELEILTPDRTWRIRAPSAEELDDWLSHLDMCMQAALNAAL